MKFLFFLFIYQFLFDGTNTQEYDDIIIFRPLLLGFDQYEYSYNYIQFYTYLRIIGFPYIYNISFPVSIKSNGRLRNLEENILNITCTNDNTSNYDYIYYFICSKPYNKTPSSIKFLNYKDFFVNGKKTNKLILTSYAKYLGSYIQEQTRNNSYLKPEILFFYNSTIINQIKNITIKGKYYNEFSKNAYLIFNKENEKDFPCIMETNEEENDTYFLICKHLFLSKVI